VGEKLVDRMKREMEKALAEYMDYVKGLPEGLEARLQEIYRSYLDTAKDIESLVASLDKDILFSRTIDVDEESYPPQLCIKNRINYIEVTVKDRVYRIPHEENLKIKVIIYKED